jgi:hypothetical protein
MSNIPIFFQPILWSYDFSALDADKHKKTIVVQTINYGRWKHWRWIRERYGKNGVAEIIASEPASAFRKPALFLAKILFNVPKQDHALRSAHR